MKFNVLEERNHSFYCQSCFNMPQCKDNSIALTITSPPYWNSIDYDTHSRAGNTEWYRKRGYDSFGASYDDFLDNLEKAFKEVLRVTMQGGFCAIVVGTILHKTKLYPAPMAITERMLKMGWDFHQDIVWNKVTGGVRRAGCYIQKPFSGYYYPNIMTEYILVFRKEGNVRRGKKEALPVDDVFTKDIANNVWHIAPVPPRTINHPCPYPQELVRRLLLLYSQEHDTILDPFLGSGQTALVALQHHRNIIGYDVEQKYIQLVEERLKCPSKSRKHHLIPRYDKILAKR